MNLDELRSTQEKERRKDKLQHLRDSFYEHVAAYIADLRASRDRRAEQIDNPFADAEISQLSDEIDTAEEVAEAVYERRVGKVVKLASFAAADMPVEEEGMTALERALYEDLVARIKQNKQNVLSVLAGDGPTEQVTPTDPTELANPADSTATARTASPEESTAAGDPDTPADDADQLAASTDRPDGSGRSVAASDTGPSPSDSQKDGGMLADAMTSQSDAETIPSGGHSDDDSSPGRVQNTEVNGDAAPEISEIDAERRGEPGQPVPETDGNVSSGDPSAEDPPDEASGSQPYNSHPSTDGGAVSTPTGPPSEVDTSTGEPNSERSPDPADDTSGLDDTPDSSETASSDPHRDSTTTVSTESADSSSRQTPGSVSDTTGMDPSPDTMAQSDEPPSTAAGQEFGSTVDERATVRITSDVGEILGVDGREYDLSPEDVITLPELNAQPLLDQDAATRID